MSFSGGIIFISAVLISIDILACPLDCAAQGYRRVEKKSAGAENSKKSRDIFRTVNSFYGFLKEKNAGGLYDSFPAAYTSGVLRDDFVRDSVKHAVFDQVAGDDQVIERCEIRDVALIGKDRACVTVVLNVFDMLAGSEIRTQESFWVEENGVWACPELYRKIIGRSKRQADAAGSFEQELKKEIIKDEVYDFIRSD